MSEEMKMTATLLGNRNSNGRGSDGTIEQKLYKMDPPHEGNEYVVASASTIGLACEVYLFPADSTGKIIGWQELPGSYRGGLDHDDAIASAGYEVV